MVFNQINKYVGIKILNYFIFNPETDIHIKELARKLKISPSTAKYYCDLYLKEKILNLVVKGNLRLFSLNNEYVFVKELKKTFALLCLKELGIENIIEEGTIAIYGSYASGNFDEKSDIDILVIGPEKRVNKDIALKIERRLGKEVQLTILPYYKWEKMKEKKEKEPFVQEVLKKYVLIKGEEL